MKELENHAWLIGYIVSNAYALIVLFFAVLFPRVARVLFLLLFALASYINWKTALQSPHDYVQAGRDWTFMKWVEREWGRILRHQFLINGTRCIAAKMFL